MATESKPTNSLAHYRLLGRSGLRVSPLCLGTMGFGERWDWMGKMQKDVAEKIFDTYVSKGGNFIDTANFYQGGQSEEWLGEFVSKRGIRDDLVIATKYSLPQKEGVVNSAGNHRKSLLSALENSLKRLNTYYVDIYYVHYWDFATPTDELLRALDDVVRSGKVHYVAISDSPAWEVSRANTMAELHGWSQFVAYQGLYHFGVRDEERDIIPMAEKLGLGLVPWGIMGSGKYSGKYKRGETAVDVKRTTVKMTYQDYNISEAVVKVAQEVNRTPAQVTVNWVLNRWQSEKAKPFPLIGPSSNEQLEDTLKSLEFTLSSEHIITLDEVSKLDLGFPHTFIGTSYKTNPWLKKAGIIV